MAAMQAADFTVQNLLKNMESIQLRIKMAAIIKYALSWTSPVLTKSLNLNVTVFKQVLWGFWSKSTSSSSLLILQKLVSQAYGQQKISFYGQQKTFYGQQKTFYW